MLQCRLAYSPFSLKENVQEVTCELLGQFLFHLPIKSPVCIMSRVYIKGSRQSSFVFYIQKEIQFHLKIDYYIKGNALNSQISIRQNSHAYAHAHKQQVRLHKRAKTNCIFQTPFKRQRK